MSAARAPLTAARSGGPLRLLRVALLAAAGGPCLRAAALTVAAATALLGRRAGAERLDAAIRTPARRMRHPGHDGHRRREPDEEGHRCSAKPAHNHTYRHSGPFSPADQGHLR